MINRCCNLRFPRRAALTFLLLLMTGSHVLAARLKVLIIDGQNNHAWTATTPVLKKILEDAGLFTVEVTTTPTRPTAPGLPKSATPEQKAAHAEKLQAFMRAEAD